MLLKIVWRGRMVLGMTKVDSSLKYKKYWCYTREKISTPSVWSAKPGSETGTSHHLPIHSVAGLRKSLVSVTDRRVLLLKGPALFFPQCLEEKTMNKMQSGVWGVQRTLLSLGTQKLTGEDDRQGNSSAVTMHWQVSLVPGGSREVLSLQEWL